MAAPTWSPFGQRTMYVQSQETPQDGASTPYDTAGAVSCQPYDTASGAAGYQTYSTASGAASYQTPQAGPTNFGGGNASGNAPHGPQPGQFGYDPNRHASLTGGAQGQ